MESAFNKDEVAQKIAAMKAKAQAAQAKNKNRVTQPFQTLAIEIAEKLGDKAHLAIYMRIAKNRSRGDIDTALAFVSDSNANNKARLFMWKLKQLKGAR